MKAPGIDGFGSKFFKATWGIIKKDVIVTVIDFFNHDKMYRAINCTLVTLIPKSSVARTVKDYRPISCCTTIYKVISKNMTRRLGKVMQSIINRNQAAFVQG